MRAAADQPIRAQRMRRSLLALLIVAASAVGSALVQARQSEPAVPPATNPDVADAALASRIAAAKESGVWVVQEGDHLYRIARHFFPTDRVMIERMREQLVARNSHAFMAGKPALLIVGATLRLPMELITGAVPPPRPAATPVAAGDGPARDAPATSTAPGPVQDENQVPPPQPPAHMPTAAPATAGEKTVITRLDPNAPAEASATPQPRPAYVDKVIEGVAQDDEAGGNATAKSERLGRRTLSIGHTQAVRERTEGTSRDQALDLRLSFETLDYGDFRLDTQWIRFTPGAGDLLPNRRSFNATLYHSQFALPGGLVADSALGVVRSIQPLWLSSSQRVVLPTTLLSGLTTRIGGERGEIRLALGEPGRLAGIGILDFERTSGRFATASGSYALAQGVLIGGAVLRLTDSSVAPDHTAATAAVDYSSGGALRGKTQLLANAGGNRGYWSDWELNQHRWRHRAGAYHLDPDLLYGDSRPQNDVRGAYWRSELRRGFDTYVAGVERSMTNIRDDPARAGTSSTGVYGNLALRIDRNTSVGAGLSWREDRPRQGSGDRRNVAIVSAYGSRQNFLGFTRIDGTVNRTRSMSGGNETISTMQLSHDFPRWNQISASTSLSLTRESLIDGQVDRRVASLSLRGPLVSNMLWDASVSWVTVDGQGQSERGYNANIGIDWPISAHWAANLSWQRNEVRPGIDNPLNPFRRENTVLLNVRYDMASGTPYARVVGPGGRQGTGTIAGFVFFDENGDGVRQPAERGADGVLLVLDGRFVATTNRDGYFTFGSVPLGTHAVAVQLERVPLPWGLSDETPRQIVVRLREETRLDIGLTRISP